MFPPNKRLIKRTGKDPIVSVFLEICEPFYEKEFITTSIFSTDSLLLTNLQIFLKKRISYARNVGQQQLLKENYFSTSYSSQSCLNFQFPHRMGFPLNHQLSQLKFETTAVFFLNLATSIIEDVPSFLYTVENVYVTENESFANLTDITGLCFLLRQKPISKEQFGQFCSYLDSRVLQRKPQQKMNHQLKLNSMFVVLLSTAIQTPINFLAWFENKKQPLANQLTIPQCKQILKKKPEFYKQVIGNKRNTRIIKTLSQEIGVDLIDIFTKVLVDEKVYSWVEIVSMLFHRSPEEEKSNVWLAIANKIWYNLLPSQKQHFFQQNILPRKKEDVLNLQDYEGFLVAILDARWQNVLRFSSFQDFMLNKEASTPQTNIFWNKCMRIIGPLLDPNEDTLKPQSQQIISASAILKEIMKFSEKNLTKEMNEHQRPVKLRHHRLASIQKYTRTVKL